METSLSLTLRTQQLPGQGQQAFHMLAPTEVARPPQAVLRKFFPQTPAMLNLQY